MVCVLIAELVEVASGVVFEVVAGAFWNLGGEGLVEFEGVETDDVMVAVWEDVFEYGGLDGLAAKRSGVNDCFADDELMCASVFHEVDDAFAVDADLLYEFVTAAFGSGVISVVAFI